MFSHRFDDRVSTTVVAHWFLLSFNGGAINSGGFLATGKFVSHVTGFATLFGEGIANRNFEVAFGLLSVPFFFLIGAFIAGLLIDRPILRNERPYIDWVMGLSAACLFLAGGGAETLHVGEFGELIGLKQSYVFLALLCMACGLQNGAISSSSGKSVRTTHLTGLTTDLGLGLSRVLTLNLRDDRVKNEIRANYLRIGSISSFVLGSAVGSAVFLKFGYQGFLLPALICCYVAWHGRQNKFNPTTKV